MARKRSVWRWLLISFGVLVILVIGAFIMLMESGRDSGEDARRVAIATALKKQAEEYHRTHGEYPPLDKLDPPHKDVLAEYIKSRVITYERDPRGEQYFLVRMIFSGPYRTKGSKFSMSRNGMQYSNKREMIRGNNDSWKTNRYGFYIWDLH